MKVMESDNEKDLLITSITVEIKQYGTRFTYSMGGGYEQVRLDYPKGEIRGTAKGLRYEMYLARDIMGQVLTSSRALYGFVRSWSSFEYLLPEDYLR
jgi:hypothetical protein